jgi:ribosome-binding factor A
MSIRTDKISSVIQRLLGEQMQLLELPFLTTITKVETTPDLKHAKVWISVMPAGEGPEAKTLQILRDNIYDLQGALIKGMEIKIVPRVAFAIDHAEEFSAHINDLIRKTHEEE